jgi:hypothetical protein
MSYEYEPADRELSADELRQVGGMRPETLREIDAELLGNCTERWRKIAFVVGTTMSSDLASTLDLPDVFYAQRVRQLVLSGALEAQGNLPRMRYSEVRKASSSSGKI